MCGKAVAKHTRKLFGTNDPEVIANREGLEVTRLSLPRRWWDILLRDFVTIRDDISLPFDRWCLAHCLGHYLMHHGNQLKMKDRGVLIRSRLLQEAEAESFAAWLLVPEAELEEYKQAEGENLILWKVAEHFVIPADMVPFRLGNGDNPYLKSIGW
jgi:Zn-dependent peptidase ImmA (M78 family)